jgi:hypothetical protein
VVHRAELTEVSVTDVPSNAACVVTKRYPYQIPAAVEFYDLIIQKVAVLQKVVQHLATVAAAPPPKPRRPTAFSQLVSELNSRHGAQT